MNERLKQSIGGLAMAVAIVALVWPADARAGLKISDDKYVRTANYFLRAGTDITPDMYPELARHDLLIFPAEAQIYNRAMFARLRSLNPNIMILAYVPSKSWNSIWVDPLHVKLRSGIQESWWLLDQNGHRTSVWPGTQVLSSVSGWKDYLPQFVHDEIWSTGLWDGVFYDELSVSASWINGGNVDIHRDGIKDDPRLLDAAWERATIHLLKRTRDLLGKEALVITNGDSTGSIQHLVNGRMFEMFPTPWEAGGTWSGVMANYLNLHRLVGYDPALIINGTTDNTGNNSDYRKMRYALTSTLMSDGFFSFDFGDQSHGQLWHYDEEDVALGVPLSGAFNTDNPTDGRVRSGVWRRDYANGVAIVNASGTERTIELGGEFEKIRGEQDSAVNDGSIVTSVTIPSNDGLLLMRRVEKIRASAFPNGAFVNVFNTAGEKERNGFFAFDESGDGSATVISTPLEEGFAPEKVVASNGRVKIIDSSGRVRKTFSPYTDAYTGPIGLAVGDLNQDGISEIVTGAGPGGGPQIRIFNKDGKLIHPGWFAYSKHFRGGVSVAIGDIYGTGRPVIIAGAGPGGGPHMRIFSRTGRLLNPGWFAYSPSFKGGISVATGDLNGDGRDEIITSPGKGHVPTVKAFSSNGRSAIEPFSAAKDTYTGGITVGIADTNNDGKDEILAYTTSVFSFENTR